MLLERQIISLFYERTALSRNKQAMLTNGAAARTDDAVSADEEIRNPLALEFLDLKDEYSETDLEDALIRHLESFLLELGGAFTFVGRQCRLAAARRAEKIVRAAFNRGKTRGVAHRRISDGAGTLDAWGVYPS